jgi:hypothetical protein
MNGFRVSSSGPGAATVDASRVVPPGCADCCRFEAVPGGETVLTWGNVKGDIHCVSQGDESFLLLSGYVLGVNSQSRFNDQTDAARFCLARLDEFDSIEALGKWLTGLHGSYALYYRNRKRNLTLCITDRVASRPLWRKWHSSGWLVSSHSTALELSAPSGRFDETALGSFLLYGGPVDPCRSLFDGVWGASPGSIVSLSAGGQCDEHRWYTFRHQADPTLSLADWVELISVRLLRAATRLLESGDSVAVFFSGGTDSRLAAAALKAAGGDPLLVTLGDRENLEVKVARAAANALGLRHEVVLRDPHWYLRSLPRVIYESGGNYAWIHGHFAQAAADIAADSNADCVVLGDLCEAFSKLCCSVDEVRSTWTAESFTAAFDRLRLPLYRPADRQATLSLLNPKLRPGIEESIRDEITRLYLRVSSSVSDPYIVGDQCMRWDSVQTIPTFLMFLDCRSQISERNVMLDFDVHEVLERLPAAFRNERNLGARLLHRLHPQAARVMNSNSMLPMYWPPATHKLARRIKPVLGRLRRSLFANTHRTTGSWPKHSILYAHDPKWRRAFDDLLSEGELFDEALFDRAAIADCWQEFLRGRAQRLGDVEKLMQLAMLHRLLLSAPAPP